MGSKLAEQHREPECDGAPPHCLSSVCDHTLFRNDAGSVKKFNSLGVKNQGLFSYLSIPPPLNPLPPGEGKEYFRMDTSYMLLFQVRRALLSPVLRFAR
jgi:hypothetical protein